MSAIGRYNFSQLKLTTARGLPLVPFEDTEKMVIYRLGSGGFCEKENPLALDLGLPRIPVCEQFLLFKLPGLWYCALAV